MSSGQRSVCSHVKIVGADFVVVVRLIYVVALGRSAHDLMSVVHGLLEEFVDPRLHVEWCKVALE